MQTFIKKELSDAYEAGQLIENHQYRFNTNRILETNPLPDIGLMDYGKDDFGGKSDEALALGKAFTALNFTAEIVKNDSGRTCMKQLVIQGEINDLYDFSYFDLGINTWAAIVQLGHNIYTTGYSKGNIFWDTIKINTTINYTEEKDYDGTPYMHYSYCF